VAKTKAVSPNGISFAATQMLRKASNKMNARHEDLLKKLGVDVSQDGRYGLASISDPNLKILRVDRHGTTVKFRIQVYFIQF